MTDLEFTQTGGTWSRLFAPLPEVTIGGRHVADAFVVTTAIVEPHEFRHGRTQCLRAGAHQEVYRALRA
jgi:hypothetical protein